LCGKEPQTADLQDLLIHVVEAIATYAHRAGQLGATDRRINRCVVEALFATVTNVNFDPDRIAEFISRAAGILELSKDLYRQACNQKGKPYAPNPRFEAWQVPQTQDQMLEEAKGLSIARRLELLGPDVCGLQELILYGLKGMAAYADHAMILGKEDQQVWSFFLEVLDFLCSEKAQDPASLTEMALKVGQMNLRVMELLDLANTSAYGHPQPTVVRVTPKKGKAILVSGHDLKDLDMILQQTAGKGIDVYTHGEMLPALAYPGLKRYKHLVGNYGGAWQDQQLEFEVFPGAIVMTTNCLQRPRPSYVDRIFTTGLVGWPGVRHIADKDFSPVIEAALRAPGFAQDGPEQTITIGFGHEALMAVAEKVIQAVKAGKIRHFFLIGGCDGAKPGRNYYTEFAQLVPKDCVILTLACGKYRFNKLDFGQIDGIPRILDMGQCNDAYSAIRVASALADAFGCSVNELPLSMILSWYEQKAVVILLTLLYLGIKGIRLGPTLPAFVGPGVFGALQDRFGIRAITTPQQDLVDCLGRR
jgi:hydroxylamine reductase